MGKKSKITKFQVVIFGAKKVGKYSLREQYVKGWIAPKDFNAPPGSESKVENLEKKKYEVAARVCGNVEDLEDTSSCNGIIMVYNISDESSIQYIKSTLFPGLKNKFDTKKESSSESPDNAESNKEETVQNSLSVPIVLAGNKADEAKLSRAVSAEDGENLSRELGCSGFFETSATCNENISKVFGCLLKEMAQQAASTEVVKEKKKSRCTIS